MRDRDLTTFVVVRPRLRAAVPGDRRQQGARRPRPAVDAADLATAAPATGETIGKAKACYAGGAVQIYLNLAGRDPARRRPFQQVAGRQEAAEVARIKAAFLALEDPNDWTGDGQPEGWKVIDRAFTKAEARYIPNGARQHRRHGAPDPHRRPRRVLLPAVPVRRGDARHADRALGVLRPARLRARRAGPATATRTCARRSSPAATRSSAASCDDVRSIDLAPTAAFLLDIPAPQHSQGVVRRDLLDDGRKYTPVSIVGLNDFHGQLDPATTHDRRPHHRRRRRRGAARDAVRRGGARRCRAGRCCSPAATTSARRRRARRCSRTCRRSTSRTRGTSTPRPRQPRVRLRRSSASSQHQARATSRSCRRTSSRRTTGDDADWMRDVDGLPRQRRARRRDRLDRRATRRSSSRAGNTAGLVFLDEAERIERESARLRRRGVKVQVVVIHEGAVAGANRVGGQPAAPWTGPIIDDRQQAAEHDDRPRRRRPHAPGGQHGRRPDPGRRGLQRRASATRSPS